MKADVYISFYDNTTGLGWWRAKLIQFLTGTKVNHVGLIFNLPFTNLTPMVMDGKECRLMTEFMLEQKGAKLLYKKYMGNVDICLEDIKQITKEHKIWTWYKVLLWFLIGRWFGITPHHCGTLAANWLNKNLKYNFKQGGIPSRLLEEVKNDYSNDWR